MRVEAKDNGVASAASAEVGLLLFGLSTELYALRIEDVVEVMGLPRTTPVPRTAAYLLGVCFRHGHLLPILDLGCRLGLRPAFRRAGSPLSRAERPAVVVARSAGGELGLLVDRIVRVARVPELAIQRAEAGSCTLGAVVTPLEKTLLLDLEALDLESKP